MCTYRIEYDFQRSVELIDIWISLWEFTLLSEKVEFNFANVPKLIELDILENYILFLDNEHIIRTILKFRNRKELILCKIYKNISVYSV